MAELLSAGVFIEEAPSQVQVIQPVSTSNVGIIGFTKRGPTDKATLVTSFDQFQRTFGGLTKNSFVPHQMAAYFANGGRRAFVVRVVPADAVLAECKLQSKVNLHVIHTAGAADNTISATAATTPFNVNGGLTPLIAKTVDIKWRAAATPVTDGAINNSVGSAITGNGSTDKFDGQLPNLPAYDSVLYSIVPTNVTLKWDSGSAKTLQIDGPVNGGDSASATSPAGTVATLDFRTGKISIAFAGTEIPAAAQAVTLSYTPATATMTATENPDGSGALVSADLSSGAITHATGAFTISFGASKQPHNKCPVVANYKIDSWKLNPVSKGVWGNDLKVLVSGHIDSYNAVTASYSKFNVAVALKNETSGAYEIVESFEELVFDDAASPNYFADVINEMSDLVVVQEPGADLIIGQLNGIARSVGVAAGDGTAKVVNTTLSGAVVAKRSVKVTYTDTTGTVQTISDDGTGRLTGSINASGTNTVNYVTGAIQFTTKSAVKAGTLVVVKYATAPELTGFSEIFGDSTKGFAVGSDGTFGAATYGRDQISAAATLSPTAKGLYALNRVEELMQVIVPDFAGDVTVTKDLLDYAEERAAQPAGGDRFVLLATPKGASPQEAVDWVRYEVGQFSKFAAIYWPWVKVADPLSNNRSIVMPPLGHVAGVYARTDSNRNVGKSPGGTVDGALRYLNGLERETTLGERDLVYPNRVNPLISSPQTGMAVWGVRTLAIESEWRYVNVRRLFMFVERSVFNSTHWTVFENNGPALWSRIKTQLNGFLTALFNEGYFAGNSPSQAFFVIVDETNNTADTIARGEVIIDVGIAANKPAEFVRFRFAQKVQE